MVATPREEVHLDEIFLFKIRQVLRHQGICCGTLNGQESTESLKNGILDKYIRNLHFY